tara:strand:- start:1204 stop:2160 length:957 start_codon:yes stop_codon:yes gene_type:complete
MIINIPNSSTSRSSEITNEKLSSRRTFLRNCIKGSFIFGFSGSNTSAYEKELKYVKTAESFNSLKDKLTKYSDATTYNNYYEFGTNKTDPSKYASNLITEPWSILIDGEVKKPYKLDLDSLKKISVLEERVYRLRCVEGWSMVIPWIGYSLSNLIKRCQITKNAKYIEFTTVSNVKQMRGLRSNVLSWPYTEGLRLDEAMHPLTLLCFGMYGKSLPNQNGAPLRVIIPWKYGFKSAKSIIRIRFTEEEPKTAWNTVAPNEYGFYSNVNPYVSHPRWSQSMERRIGEDSFFSRKRETLMFNGYEEVSNLYFGMDLKKFF